MNRNSLVGYYLQTEFTPKRSEGFFPLHFSMGYQERSALKTCFDSDYLGNRLMRK